MFVSNAQIFERLIRYEEKGIAWEICQQFKHQICRKDSLAFLLQMNQKVSDSNTK